MLVTTRSCWEISWVPWSRCWLNKVRKGFEGAETCMKYSQCNPLMYNCFYCCWPLTIDYWHLWFQLCWPLTKDPTGYKACMLDLQVISSLKTLFWVAMKLHSPSISCPSSIQWFHYWWPLTMEFLLEQAISIPNLPRDYSLALMIMIILYLVFKLSIINL